MKHGALLDAQLLAQLYVELCGGRQIGLGLADDAPIVIDTLGEASASVRAAARPIRAPRVHRPSPDEMQRHQAFVATLVNPVWATYGPAVDAPGGQA